MKPDTTQMQIIEALGSDTAAEGCPLFGILPLGKWANDCLRAASDSCCSRSPQRPFGQSGRKAHCLLPKMSCVTAFGRCTATLEGAIGSWPLYLIAKSGHRMVTRKSWLSLRVHLAICYTSCCTNRDTPFLKYEIIQSIRRHLCERGRTPSPPSHRVAKQTVSLDLGRWMRTFQNHWNSVSYGRNSSLPPSAHWPAVSWQSRPPTKSISNP